MRKPSARVLAAMGVAAVCLAAIGAFAYRGGQAFEVRDTPTLELGGEEKAGGAAAGGDSEVDGGQTPRSSAGTTSGPDTADSASGAAGDGEQVAPAEASEEPAEPTEGLKRLSEPPDSSVWALPADKFDSGASLAIVFEPYGYGPDAMGASVAVAVVSAKSNDPAKRTPDIAGKNVVLILGEAEVEHGGLYEATVVLRPSGERLVLRIERLSARTNP